MKENAFLFQAVITLVPMILSLTVHEYAHALVARWLGDRTAEEEGRVTLSPLSHIDIWGTLVVPLLLVASGTGAFFGWAKPVPYNPLRFDKRVPMRRGAMLVAAAGPVSNFLFALLIVVGFGLAQRFGAVIAAPVVALASRLVLVNIGLGFFNLLPVPPLDGSKVLWGALPHRNGDAYMRLMDSAGTVAFLLVVVCAGTLLSGPMQGAQSFLFNVVLPAVRGA